jgi:hypothetical protein
MTQKVRQLKPRPCIICGIRWCSPDERQAASDALVNAGHDRLAAQLLGGASVDAVRASAEQQQNVEALAIIRDRFGEREPGAEYEPPALVVRLLGPEEDILVELGPFSDSITYSCGSDEEGPSICTDGALVVARNDKVNPGLWVDGVLYESCGFAVELCDPGRGTSLEERTRP